MSSMIFLRAGSDSSCCKIDVQEFRKHWLNHQKYSWGKNVTTQVTHQTSYEMEILCQMCHYHLYSRSVDTSYWKTETDIFWWIVTQINCDARTLGKQAVCGNNSRTGKKKIAVEDQLGYASAGLLLVRNERPWWCKEIECVSFKYPCLITSSCTLSRLSVDLKHSR